MFSPRKSVAIGHQGSMFQYIRSSHQPSAPLVEDESTDDEVDEIPYRAPSVTIARPHVNVTMPPSTAHNESLTDSQLAEDALVSDINRVNDELDAQDDDFTPAPSKRKSDADAGPSKKAKTNASPAKPYEQCCVATRAERDEFVRKISKIWSEDHTSWPTYPFAPARASIVFEPKEWGKPILQKVEELSRAANDKGSAGAALSVAVGARKTLAGERIWMTTIHIDAAIAMLLSKERVRAPTGAPITTAAEEALENARPDTTDTAQSLNAMTDAVGQPPVSPHPPAAQPPAPPQNSRAKQDARIKAILDCMRHLDTETLRNIACHMIDVANSRDEHEIDMQKKEAALVLACSGT